MTATNPLELKSMVASCQFCENWAIREIPSRYGINKPKKWAHHIGGTMREPIHFFICDTCSKRLTYGTKILRG